MESFNAGKFIIVKYSAFFGFFEAKTGTGAENDISKPIPANFFCRLRKPILAPAYCLRSRRTGRLLYELPGKYEKKYQRHDERVYRERFYHGETEQHRGHELSGYARVPCHAFACGPYGGTLRYGRGNGS